MVRRNKQKIMTLIATIMAVLALCALFYVGFVKIKSGSNNGASVDKESKSALTDKASANLRGAEISECPTDYTPVTEGTEESSIEGVPDPLNKEEFSDIVTDPDFKPEWHNEFDVLYMLHEDLDLLVAEEAKGTIIHLRTAAYPGKDFENFCCKYLDKLKQELKDKGYGNYDYEFVKMVHGAYPADWADIDINENMDLYILKWTKVQG